MARARNIKPSFFRSEQVVSVSFEWRLLFAGLWTMADREGKLLDRPKTIKMELFPSDSLDVDSGLKALMDVGLIIRYSINGINYIHIPEFLKHQNPHPREIPSTIPNSTEQNLGNAKAMPRIEQYTSEDLPSNADSPSPFPLPIVETLSGKPDVMLKNGKQKFKVEAESLITFLNEKTGKQFRPVEANLDMVASRLKEGVTVEDCRAMIAKKSREWKGTEMEQYLRPATLFNKTKFAQYIGELCHD